MADEPEIQALRSLRPTYIAAQHADYVQILKTELAKGDSDAPRNIALTGHYGSGKSSVLVELQRELETAGTRVINLSLPSLGIGDGRLPKDGDPALDKTNLIQKEIVKQLLYRRKPSDTPASRYNRLDTFHQLPAYRRAAVVGAAAAGLALLLRLPQKVQSSVPATAWKTLDSHFWHGASGTLQWLSLLVVFGVTVMAAVAVQRLLQQRLRITELSAGPTKVTLSEPTASYFDEYLDEIVYFFQTSKTEVVIFEDLDRFEDPHIFEALRELNLLLNNAEQTGNQPIRFVYAIRDSIFEKIDKPTAPSADESNGSASDDGETRRLTSTNRTKFFDLVVPMVPFISHRTSRDLIRRELGEVDASQRPSDAVIDLVSVHLTDMRLIKNICNEYDVFRRRILTDSGLKELSADRLFASIVYKNLYLADYEKIRDGKSRLDVLYAAYRGWVAYQMTTARADERRARARLRRLDAIDSRSGRLGKRLQQVLVARYSQPVNTTYMRVTLGGTNYGWADLEKADFWRAYVRDQGILQVYYQYGQENLAFANVQTLMGEDLSPADWAEEERTELQNAVTVAVSSQHSVAHTSLSDALGEQDKLFVYEGDTVSLGSVAERLFEGADEVLELLRAGFIDENFTLYVTQFPGQSISASAMNFIIKAVQPDVMDIEYHFGAGEDVEAADIEAVLEAEGPRVLGGHSVYNLEIFDHLLASEAAKLEEPIRRLAAGAATDLRFIDAYLSSGKRSVEFVRRLSAVWPGVFDYLIGQDPDARSRQLLDAALAGARPGLTYVVSEEQRDAVAAALPELETITTPQSAEQARAIASTMEQMDVRAVELASVAEPLRGEIVARSLYRVSLANLRTILGEAALSLDHIKSAHATDVYPFVLSHLDDYLAALDDAEAVKTVVDPDSFADVLGDVGDASPGDIYEIARRAGATCMLHDLNSLDAGLWPAVVSAHRLTLTVRNVAAYIAEHGIDENLAGWLSSAGVIEVGEGGGDLAALALDLLNAERLTDDVKLSLVDSLSPGPSTVSAASLVPGARRLLPMLVHTGLVEDGPDAYNSLSDDEWQIKEALISVSTMFPSYLSSLTLGTNELFWIASGRVPDAVKDALLDQLDSFADELRPKGATALASWAAANGRKPAPDALVTLASKGGTESATAIIRLLGVQAATIDLASLTGILNALGRPFSQLTNPGRDRPRVSKSEGILSILDRLNEAGIVSKYGERAKGSLVEVSKRHG